MIEKADLTDKAVNQIAEIIKEPIKAKDKEIERLNNIIKEAKEYIEQNYSAIVGRIEKIYKILDKGE